ncbi:MULTISPECIES: undecaprenyl-diphosphatase [unclassified Paenibacillus]|uniref:undecaprenyl-diphosphatase n=1 Tax=unclassified Paenibacillus TaxID=185978 RepID=UPI00083849BD|nr:MULTISPECIES: undecaprenyl-diphosphatase [unclassified Paenibacillus]NWL89756.1 undecaprenyl-diphosphatase [Paenibacillus sp. 79R4]
MLNIAQFDHSLFEAIHQFALSLPGLNPAMRILSQKAEYLFYLGIIIYWFSRGRENKKMVLVALFAACAAFGTGSVLAHFFYRDRPFVQYAFHPLIEHAANASFPSDHSIGSFVIATAIFLYRRKDGTAWLLLAGLVSFSRIWNGVHFPFDVITGALLGVLSAILVKQLFQHWSLANRSLNAGLDLYEGIVRKVG